jgi:hypothetical protein
MQRSIDQGKGREEDGAEPIYTLARASKITKSIGSDSTSFRPDRVTWLLSWSQVASLVNFAGMCLHDRTRGETAFSGLGTKQWRGCRGGTRVGLEGRTRTMRVN